MLLPHSVTLWNRAGGEIVSKGAKIREYNKVYIKYVRIDNNVQGQGGAPSGSFYVEIYNGVSVTHNLGAYVEPGVYAELTRFEKLGKWTLNPGSDYIGFGLIGAEFPSPAINDGDNPARKDYLVHTVDAKYGADGEIHHWEVYCK